jgi:hypothetical protein
MLRLLFLSVGADRHRQSVKNVSVTHLTDLLHQHIRLGSRLADDESNALKHLLVFTLQVSFGAIAAAGTILALFTWSGAGL